MKNPCVRCLCPDYKRINRDPHKILQCVICGWNVTATTWEQAEAAWDDFKVWELVDSLRAVGAGK